MAKMQLAGKYSTYIGAYALYFMISGMLTTLLGFFLIDGSFVSSRSLSSGDIVQMIIYFIVELIISLILSVFSLGFNKMFLDGSRGYRVRFEDLFYGFRHHPDRVILLQFILLMISVACLAPGYILLLCSVTMKLPTPVLVLGVVVMIVGVVVMIYFSLCFCQSTYLIADYDDLGPVQALKESRKMMNGKKGKYLYLQLSFLGIIFLCILTCYIGFLWAIPYLMMAQTNFYRNITNEI